MDVIVGQCVFAGDSCSVLPIRTHMSCASVCAMCAVYHIVQSDISHFFQWENLRRMKRKHEKKWNEIMNQIKFMTFNSRILRSARLFSCKNSSFCAVDLLATTVCKFNECLRRKTVRAAKDAIKKIVHVHQIDSLELLTLAKWGGKFVKKKTV